MTSFKTGLAIAAATLLFFGCSEDKTLPETTMTSVSQSGGVALSADGNLELRFPSGALKAPTDITIQTKRGELVPRAKSFVYELGPDGTTFDQDVVIRIMGVDSDEELTIAQVDDGKLIPVDGATWDSSRREVTATLKHFSSYAVIIVYNPCGTSSCGDSCVICDPLDPTCVEPPPSSKACNQSGLCVDAALPMCTPAIDAGVPRDAGSPPDSGLPGRDGGTPRDAGGPPDSGLIDAGPPLCVDTANQNPQPVVDILLVVDDSGSMAEEQAALAANFNLLLDTLVQNNTDFHIGVTTTDTTMTGAQGNFIGTIPIIDNATPNLAAEFAANVNAGTSGSAIETGLEASRLNLSVPLASSFHRAGSGLTVIYVSDEDDQSIDQPADYVDAFRTAKGAYADRRLQLNTISGGVGGCSGTNGVAGDDARYEAVRAATSGAHDPVCTGPYSNALTDLGGPDYGYEFLFALSQTPTDTSSLVVTVDGVPATGWIYDGAENAIVFDELQVPAPSAVIDISYVCN